MNHKGTEETQRARRRPGRDLRTRKRERAKTRRKTKGERLTTGTETQRKAMEGSIGAAKSKPVHSSLFSVSLCLCGEPFAFRLSSRFRVLNPCRAFFVPVVSPWCLRG